MDSSPASEAESTSLRSIRYKRGQLHLLDQRKLPFEIAFIEISNSRQGWHAIKDMVVRGAPAIAIAAALSLAVELVNLEQKFKDSHEALSFIQERLDYLISSRPTAVNLFEAAKMLRNIVENVALSSSSSETVVAAYVMAAEGMLSADVRANKSIGSYGAKLIMEGTKRDTKGEKLQVLTHCNTGSLATAAYGTALGVIRSLHSEAKVETAYCTETRPYNQGSRLTAFELMHDNIPAVLIADSAAGFLQASGKVDAVIVGADRVASNGDTANKIGTYNLALLSFHHGIPFYVAAPLTSIDMSILSGEQIIIEERPPLELTHSHGGQGSQIAAPGISVWNPAFDITPAKFITAIITDRGIITRKNGSSNFDIQSFLNELDTSTELAVSREMDDVKANESIRDFDFNKGTHDYRVLDEESVLNYISSYPNLARRLGGTMKNWTVHEVGDGNLNFVYIVLGPSGSLVLKQAVPYVRCVGESWPLTSDRSYFEALVLKQHGDICPDHVPKLYHVNCSMGIIGMEYLEPPHIILRKGLLGGISYALLAEHMSDYLTKTLYYTSLIAVSTKTHRSRVAEFCGNVELCRLTEQVIFTEPYMISPNNRWTPQLDEDVEAIREDAELKLEIANLKAKFCERAQALIHGDLHTGSIMVTTTSTKVIDPEFGFYGPIGFDIGAFLGNLLLAFFSQDGHATDINERHAYKAWILSTFEDTWRLFERKFISYWAANWENPGDAYPISVYKTAQEQELAQKTYVKEVFQDSLGFAAAKMIRRIVGIAHVEDFETIKDPCIRAQCERRALVLAKTLIKRRHALLTIGQVIEMVQDDL